MSKMEITARELCTDKEWDFICNYSEQDEIEDT